MEQPEFWNDADAAQAVVAECNENRAWTGPYKEIKSRFEGVRDLLPEAYEVKEEELIVELQEELGKIESDIEDLEIRKMLSGELDKNSCYLEINAGAGDHRLIQNWVDANKF